jgi:hypothetical protein
MRQTLEYNGHEYSWAGAFPKVVAAGATPPTSGGIGAGAWVDRTDVTLRSDINIVQKRYACVADMVADTSLTSGKIVETIGYYNGWAATGDSPKGGNRYEIVAAGTGTSDGGSYISLFNGLQAKSLKKDKSARDVYQYGAYGDNSHDDTQAFKNCIGAYSDKVSIELLKGDFLITGTLGLGTYKKIRGVNKEGVNLYFNSSDSYLFTGDAYSSLKNFTLRNITPTGNKTAIASYTPTTSNGWRNGKISDVDIHGFYYGIGSTQGLTQGLMFQNVYERVKIYDAVVGVQMGAGSNANTWINCEFWRCGTPLLLNNVTSQKFISCGFEESTVYDFNIDTSYNISFDTCYFEPAKGGVATNSTGSFKNCHSTSFFGMSTTFLTALNNSVFSFDDFTDYNLSGNSSASQNYWATDSSSVVRGSNCQVRAGTEKSRAYGLNGSIQSVSISGDWMITRYGNGVQEATYSTWRSSNAVIMTSTTTGYTGTLTIPSAFIDASYSVVANISYNSSVGFFDTDLPAIYARPASASTINVRAKRQTSVGVDGYFISLTLVGKWK